MQNNIMFDNIYIGHSIEDANKLAEQAWRPKYEAEKKVDEAEKPKVPETPKSPSDLAFTDDPVTFIKEKLGLFVALAKEDPVAAIKGVPEISGGIAALVITLVAIIASVGGSSPAVKKTAGGARDKAKAAKDKASESAATGADTAKAEVTKRTTRSSQS